MKKLILLAFLMPELALGQVASDFESGTINGWTGSAQGHWIADRTSAISGLYSLHHNYDNPSNGSDCIGLRITDLHPGEGGIKWTFSIRHGYDPSSSNNWNVMLMSDTDPVSVASGVPVNGYAVGVNLTGYDDTLRLWKLVNSIPEPVITAPVNWQTTIGSMNFAKIEVTRSTEGTWSLRVSDKYVNQICFVTGTDPQLFKPEWFILNYRYTSTRDRLLWFDDLTIDGIFRSDVKPPRVTDVMVSGRAKLCISFDEEIDQKDLKPSGFVLNGSAPASAVNKITASELEIVWGSQFRNKSLNQLSVSRFCDIDGNCSDTAFYFTPAWPEPGDIVINEIMADPVPVVGLPAREYIELFNRTDIKLDMEGFTLLAGDDKFGLPAVSFPGDGYLILCAASDTSLFKACGRTLGIKPFPVLNDDGKLLALFDSTGTLINGIEYSVGWYGENIKSKGGWSLEMIDSDRPFYSEGNFRASISRDGGTPGSRNSVATDNPDRVFSGIENVFPGKNKTLNISFSEPLVCYRDIKNDLSAGDLRIVSMTPSDPLLRSFEVSLEGDLEKGKVYTFIAGNSVTDFAGNQAERRSFEFGLPELASKNDVVFNELLFNPMPGDPDFIEFYNGCDKVINAASLYLASVGETNDTSELVPVSDKDRCIVPGSYYTITTNRSALQGRYNSFAGGNLYNISRLPSMSDGKGHLLLFNRELDVIDEAIYDEKMHHPLLASGEGVSLEKVRPDISSMDPSAWHSASESTGWATPGRENSVYSPLEETNDRVSLSSRRISPDNDGYEDVLVIDLLLQGNDNVITVSVFDETGGFIKRISRNFLAGEAASLVWDGTADDGTLVRTGIYIILTELYNPNGRTASWKKVCTVIRN